MFIPYSQRNAKAIKEKKIVLSINRNARNQIYQLLEKYNDINRKTSETGWPYDISTGEEVFNDIRQFYPLSAIMIKSSTLKLVAYKILYTIVRLIV